MAVPALHESGCCETGSNQTITATYLHSSLGMILSPCDNKLPKSVCVPMLAAAAAAARYGNLLMLGSDNSLLENGDVYIVQCGIVRVGLPMCLCH